MKWMVNVRCLISMLCSWVAEAGEGWPQQAKSAGGRERKS